MGCSKFFRRATALLILVFSQTSFSVKLRRIYSCGLKWKCDNPAIKFQDLCKFFPHSPMTFAVGNPSNNTVVVYQVNDFFVKTKFNVLTIGSVPYRLDWSLERGEPNGLAVSCCCFVKNRFVKIYFQNGCIVRDCWSPDGEVTHFFWHPFYRNEFAIWSGRTVQIFTMDEDDSIFPVKMCAPKTNNGSITALGWMPGDRGLIGYSEESKQLNVWIFNDQMETFSSKEIDLSVKLSTRDFSFRFHPCNGSLFAVATREGVSIWHWCNQEKDIIKKEEYKIGYVQDFQWGPSSLDLLICSKGFGRFIQIDPYEKKVSYFCVQDAVKKDVLSFKFFYLQKFTCNFLRSKKRKGSKRRRTKKDEGEFDNARILALITRDKYSRSCHEVSAYRLE